MVGPSMKNPDRVYVVRYKTNGECHVKDCHAPRLEDFKKYSSKALYCACHAVRVTKTKIG